jgi:methyl-accepting chemotaxis protein
MLRAWKRLGLQAKITLLFAVVNALILAVYATFSIQARVLDERKNIDSELVLAAHSYLAFVGEEKINKAVNNALPEKDCMAEIAKMGKIAEDFSLAYLYSVRVEGSTVHYVIDGAPQSDIDKGEFSLPGAEYEDASQLAIAAWNTWSPQFDNYTDSFGTFRAYFMPLKTTAGSSIIVCSEIETEGVDEKIRAVYSSEITIALAFFIFSVVLAFIFARVLSKSIIGLGKHVKFMAESRDFTKALAVDSKDEVGKMAESLGLLQGELKHAIGRAYNISAENVDHAELFISSATSIQSQVSLSSAQVGRLNGQADEISTSALKATECANSVEHNIEEAGKQLSEANQVMKVLAEGVGKTAADSRTLADDLKALNEKVIAIGRVLDSVAEISEQTNMLAINASIEAAHAGSSGAGFAVVAGQVGTLATKSQETVGESNEIVRHITQGINAIIANIAGTVEANERLSNESKGALKVIEMMHSRFAKTTSLALDSVASNESIKDSLGSMVNGLSDVSSSLDLSKTQADDIMRAASSVIEKAEDLKDQLSSFTVE